MIFETYVTSCEGNRLEYGFTFKENEGDEDTIFDLILGSVALSGKSVDEANEIIERAFKENEKYARAVCAADTGE